MKWRVGVTTEYHNVVEVEADTEDEALRLALAAPDTGDFSEATAIVLEAS